MGLLRLLVSTRRHRQTAQRGAAGQLGKADIWRRDGTEFLMADVWGRFWNAARDSAGLPEGFTPYRQPFANPARARPRDRRGQQLTRI